MKIVEIKKGVLPSFEVAIGESVVWKNLDVVAHQLNSDLENTFFRFDLGIIFPGESSSPVVFDVESYAEGFKYGCGLVPNLSGTITVANHSGHDHPGHDHPEHDHPDHDHPGHDHPGHDHLKHFHGFVTGGQSGNKIYMTHTPIFSDERHHFQIILRASFVEQFHSERYNALRNSEYGDGKVQLFFDHMALIDIQSGAIKELEADHLRYYPDVPTVRPGLVMPAVSTKMMEFKGAKIKIDKILHFRKFEPDMQYPQYMTYLMYGDDEDVFIDHFISRAPNFHSVAKLASPPTFWMKDHFDSTLKISIPSRKIVDVSNRPVKRIAFLDNQTHLIWGIPSGSLAPADPLEREPKNTSGNRLFEVLLESGVKSSMYIGKLLHFDATRLLNDGLGF